MTNTLYRATLGSVFTLSVLLFGMHVSAQSPPTATEAFNLRIKCKEMSDEKAQSFAEMKSNWQTVMTWNTSKYDPTSNRCYGRFYTHQILYVPDRPDHPHLEMDAVLDLQIDEVLASTTINNGKKSGTIFDPDYKKPGPSCNNGCPSNFGDLTWQAAEDYMNDLMAEPRK